MAASYDFKMYRPEHRTGVLELATHVWGPDHALNAAYLDWKYRDNPNISHETPLIFLALHGDKVIGMRGAHALKLEADGESGLTMPCFGDTAIDPQHRGKGLLTSLTKMAIETLTRLGYSHVFGVSNGPVTYPHLLKLGWRRVCDYRTMYLYPGRTRQHRPSFDLARRVPLLSSVAEMVGCDHRTGQTSSDAENERPFPSSEINTAQDLGGISLESVSRAEAMADLVRRLGSDGRIRQVRDAKYLAWRFKNPLCAYRFFYCGGRELDGYLVLQGRGANPFRSVNLVDWEASTDELRRHLLQAVINSGRFNSVGIWSATQKEKSLALLKKEKFVSDKEEGGNTEFRPGLLAYALGNREGDEIWAVGRRNLLKADDWDLRMICSDGY